MAWAEALLPGLDAATIAKLDAMPAMQLPKGQCLFRAGDHAQGFAMVLEGRVEVTLTAASGREILLLCHRAGAKLHPDHFGADGRCPLFGRGNDRHTGAACDDPARGIRPADAWIGSVPRFRVSRLCRAYGGIDGAAWKVWPLPGLKRGSPVRCWIWPKADR